MSSRQRVSAIPAFGQLASGPPPPTRPSGRLEPRVQRNVVAAMVSTRVILRGENNWKLYATTVEAFLHRAGEKRNEGLLFEGLTRHRE